MVKKSVLHHPYWRISETGFKGKLVENCGKRVCQCSEVSKGILSHCRGSPRSTVDDFVAIKAFDFNKSHQVSTGGSQQVQRQALKTPKFQQG